MVGLKQGEAAQATRMEPKLMDHSDFGTGVSKM